MLSHFVAKKTYNKQTLYGLFSSISLAQTPLTLFSDVVLKLGKLSQTNALTDWILCFEQSLILHCVALHVQSRNPVIKRTLVSVPVSTFVSAHTFCASHKA